jgi:hypothetical protein
MSISMEKMDVAFKVLNEVNRTINKKVSKNLWLEVYSNCREQGYCIKHKNGLSISFSENRNSDDIVVYVGTKFDMQGNVPTEESYRKARYFRYDDVSGAVNYIMVKVLEQEL